MIREAFCPNCQRIVQLERGAEMTCPVCSTPLAEAREANDVDSRDATNQVAGGYEPGRVDIHYPNEKGWEHLESG